MLGLEEVALTESKVLLLRLMTALWMQHIHGESGLRKGSLLFRASSLNYTGRGSHVQISHLCYVLCDLWPRNTTSLSVSCFLDKKGSGGGIVTVPARFVAELEGTACAKYR